MNSTGFGAIAILPAQYTTALMVGQGLSGIALGGLELILQFFVYPENSAQLYLFIFFYDIKISTILFYRP